MYQNFKILNYAKQIDYITNNFTNILKRPTFTNIKLIRKT